MTTRSIGQVDVHLVLPVRILYCPKCGQLVCLLSPAVDQLKEDRWVLRNLTGSCVGGNRIRIVLGILTQLQLTAWSLLEHGLLLQRVDDLDGDVNLAPLGWDSMVAGSSYQLEDFSNWLASLVQPHLASLFIPPEEVNVSWERLAGERVGDLLV